MTQPTPLAAFDIWPDGAAVAAPDTAPAPAHGAAWRWLHFDLRDAGLIPWSESKLPLLAAHALTQEKTRPRCDPHDSGLLLTLRAINRNPGAEADDMVSLRLWVTESLVVSVRHRRVFAAEGLRDAFALGRAPASPAGFLAELTRLLTDRIETLSLELEERTDALEDRVLAGEDIAEALAPLRTSAIKLRRHIGPQHVALNRLANSPEALIHGAARDDLAEIANRTTRSVEEIESVTQRLTALQDHVASRVAHRLGRNSYILSVVAAVFLPLGFLTGLFGVNLGGLPGTENPMGFLILCGVSLVIGLCMALLFRLMRWF